MTTLPQTTERPVKALLGTKLGMTQVWDEAGRQLPITVIEVGTNVVTQIRQADKEGYNAVQLAYGQIDPRRVTQPLRKRFDALGVTPRRHVAEVRTSDADTYEVGQELTAEAFEAGQKIDVIGTTKGKGFAGTMKRHGFSGGFASHGAKRNHRKPGSIGAAATPGRVFKGKKMSGRMGNERQTTLNLTIHGVDVEKGFLLVVGPVPGPKGGLVMVRSAVKGA